MTVTNEQLLDAIQLVLLAFLFVSVFCAWLTVKGAAE